MNRTLNFFLFAVLSLFCLGANAQQESYPATTAYSDFLGKSRPLVELEAPNYIRNPKEKGRLVVPKGVPNFTDKISMPTPFADVAAPKNGDPLVLNNQARSQNFQVLPEIVFDGIDETRTGGIFPPDPNGDVSDEHFVQTTNTFGGTYMVVYDLEGNEVFSLSNLNALWEEFNVTGFGDPVVLWDNNADRWLLTEFQDFAANSILMAVSETSDPTGSWFVYRVQTPNFPDYPKFGVWPNAYFISTNEPTDDVPIYAIDRQAMLVGADADVQAFGIPKFEDTDAFQVATPIDWDSNVEPPAGSPGYAVRMYDDAWNGGLDKVELWEIHVDWDDASNSFLSGPTELFTAPFESELCQGGDIFNCLGHPNGQTVSALQHVIMHRVPYVNYGSHESIALQFSVDVDGNNRAGIRWMELRKSGNDAWSIYQEGTHAPDDPHNRFMGSIGMDANNNILMAYTVGGSEKAFSLAYTGRLNNDPLGVLTIEEYEFAEGLSAGTNQRWGDYSAMSVNGGNGTDFWFVGEYMKEDMWGTKIMSARINRDSNDVGPQRVLSPQNSGYLTSTEQLEVAVLNYGYLPQSDIAISFTVNGSAAVTEMITDTIPPDSSYIHTFVPTVDMETIGEYKFVIYTSLESDTVFFNDTLGRTVRQLPRNDIEVIGINGFDFTVCDSLRMVDIVIRNAGVDTVTSAIITHQLNTDAPIDIQWDGVLPPGAVEFFQVLVGPFIEGTNTFKASVSMPNGVSDENEDNDARSESFEVIFGADPISLQINTDDYPQETTWELSNEAGDILYTGGPYDSQGSLFTEEFCLDPDACYNFTIFDSFGDGICCDYGEGSYIITKSDGTPLVIGDGDFEASETNNFCPNFVCTLELSAESAPESAPGANDGQIICDPSNGLPSFTYSIDGGENFQASPVFGGLSGGTYELIVRDANFCEATITVEVLTCMISLSAEVENSTQGEDNGVITVGVDGGIGPFTYQLDNGPIQDENVFTDLPAGDYTITVYDQQGCEIELEVIVDLINSADNITTFGQRVRIFPNPTPGFLRIEVEGLKDIRSLPVKIYNADGQLVRQDRLANFGGIQKGVCSLYDLPSGVYYLRFVNAQLPYLYNVVKE